MTKTEMPVIRISRRAEHQIETGSLWIFSNEIRPLPRNLPRGGWCWFECDNRIVGTGYFNPHSLIAGRVVKHGQHSNIVALLEERLLHAFEQRASMVPVGSCRLVFSEGDFIPGLIIDWYSGLAVIQSNTAGIDQVLTDIERLVPLLFERVFKQKLRGLLTRADSPIRQLEGIEPLSRIALGTETMFRDATFQEKGVFYAADLLTGQKTGAFLDQRDNRTFLKKKIGEGLAGNLLDLYCYAGGWGLAALKSGSRQVTFVDESPAALELVKKGFELNSLESPRATIIKSDVFDYLESEKGHYEIIVADPPAFVKSKKNLPQGLKAYEKLSRMAWRRLRPNGLLLASSCSYHVSDGDFLNSLTSAIAKEKGIAHIVYRGTQASDHPILLSMPETRYLKCVGLRKVR